MTSQDHEFVKQAAQFEVEYDEHKGVHESLGVDLESYLEGRFAELLGADRAERVIRRLKELAIV